MLFETNNIIAAKMPIMKQLKSVQRYIFKPLCSKDLKSMPSAQTRHFYKSALAKVRPIKSSKKLSLLTLSPATDYLNHIQFNYINFKSNFFRLLTI